LDLHSQSLPLGEPQLARVRLAPFSFYFEAMGTWVLESAPHDQAERLAVNAGDPGRREWGARWDHQMNLGQSRAELP
jgi:hypothetical protein